jgi:hypothetical protein
LKAFALRNIDSADWREGGSFPVSVLPRLDPVAVGAEQLEMALVGSNVFDHVPAVVVVDQTGDPIGTPAAVDVVDLEDLPAIITAADTFRPEDRVDLGSGVHSALPFMPAVAVSAALRQAVERAVMAREVLRVKVLSAAHAAFCHGYTLAQTGG